MQWPEDLGPIASSVYFSTPEWVERHRAEAVGLTRRWDARCGGCRTAARRVFAVVEPTFSRSTRLEGLGLTGYFEAQKL
jgi:hypothetical protein